MYQFMSRSIIFIAAICILVSPPAGAQPADSALSFLAATGFAHPPFPENAAWKSSIIKGKLKLDKAMAEIAAIVKISIAVSDNANIEINADEEPWNQDWPGKFQFQLFWARVMEKYKLVDYYSGGTITVTLPGESEGTVYAGVDPELYKEDLIPFLGSAGLFPNDPGNIEAQSRGMRIHFDEGRRVMLVQGPPQFSQQVKTIWTAIAATPPPEPGANFSVMRVHCRHANVEDLRTNPIKLHPRRRRFRRPASEGNRKRTIQPENDSGPGNTAGVGCRHRSGTGEYGAGHFHG
ncbi:MAG: hypothetical protein EOP85_10540 [Verrucomicrobiaceae bacterium]|nr:MAG: hypothetical protein EOP85_10540 [Verrucomicrobiaceae bacterium]